MNKSILLLLFTFFSQGLFAQAGGTEGSDYLLYILLAVVVIALFVIIIQVSDNMMVIEAGRQGVSHSGTNFGIFPRMSEVFRNPVPEYIKEGSFTVLRKGFDIPLEGEAEKTILDKSVSTFAVQPPNFIGMQPIPKVLPGEGDSVKAGDPLFFDKNRPEILYGAPVSGEVIEIRRGARRAIEAVVILADKEVESRAFTAFDLDNSSREALVSYMLDACVWPFLRQRPYDIVADPKDVPTNIFISTFDTAPLAPDLNFVVEGKGAAFQKGLDVLAKLTSGKVHLGLNANAATSPSAVFTGATGVEKHWFRGAHPAGNPGVQMHHIAPLKLKDRAWVLGVQDVLTIGTLFLEGRFDASRVVVVVGAELKSPAYVRTWQGAKVEDLIKDNLLNDHVRYISGDVLSGKQKSADGFLGFYDDQLTVVKEGDDYELFGWLIPQESRPSISKTYLNHLFPESRFTASTNTRGEKRAFVVTGEYERLLPMDIYPQHLIKAIINGDYESMEGLGIKELVEEDIALCEFGCLSKQELQKILREGLELMRAEE